MRGKYSPTVSAAYMSDQKWFEKYSDFHNKPENWFIYDPEGYDSYGYDENEVDRAGNREDDYYRNDLEFEDGFGGENFAYEAALSSWGFDGMKPVRK